MCFRSRLWCWESAALRWAALVPEFEQACLSLVSQQLVDFHSMERALKETSSRQEDPQLVRCSDVQGGGIP